MGVDNTFNEHYEIIGGKVTVVGVQGMLLYICATLMFSIHVAGHVEMTV